MTDTYFNELLKELHNGADQKDHPFHYFTFATTGLEGMARLRTLALREFTEDLRLFFFTDYRSKKILHIKENNKVGLLFYHPGKLLQLRIEGLAQIHSNHANKERYWSEIHRESKKDYTTTEAPGSSIEDPDTIDYLHNQNYFCIVEVIPFRIEYLKLKRPNHIRVRFSREKDQWKSEFLVP